MKPFLCADLTENKENDKLNGEELAVRSISPEQSYDFVHIVILCILWDNIGDRGGYDSCPNVF